MCIMIRADYELLISAIIEAENARITAARKIVDERPTVAAEMSNEAVRLRMIRADINKAWEKYQSK